ncbi:MAG: MaoC domain protein dehydratase [Rhodospirillales bacterium]|nr:MaoC domain protein dehydratase [Rhodospirillales bacterium]
MFAEFDTIQIGDCRSLVRTVSEADVRKFVEMTGDDNPLHVDPAFAETTSFKDVVVHGMLGASFISTVIGTQLPGPGALWVAQSFEFLLPVRLGDELTVSCTVLKKHERDRLLELETRIVNQHGQAVLTGHGKVKVLVRKTTEPAAATARPPSVAIVTGGAGGIGKAICVRLARDGHHVIVNYRGHAERARQIVAEINGGATRAIAVQADIATPAGARALYQAAIDAFGSVSVLVNNASPRINPKPFAETSWDDMQQHIDVQVKGAFLLAQACLPAMALRRHGRIINIASQVTEGSPAIAWTGYAVAKAALAMLSRYVAAEVGPTGVTVNCVAPGMTDTMLIGDIPEKLQLMAARQTPLRRLATPEDIASAVAYLASDDAAFVTGQTLRVNGGSAMP